MNTDRTDDTDKTINEFGSYPCHPSVPCDPWFSSFFASLVLSLLHTERPQTVFAHVAVAGVVAGQIAPHLSLADHFIIMRDFRGTGVLLRRLEDAEVPQLRRLHRRPLQLRQLRVQLARVAEVIPEDLHVGAQPK